METEESKRSESKGGKELAIVVAVAFAIGGAVGYGFGEWGRDSMGTGTAMKTMTTGSAMEETMSGMTSHLGHAAQGDAFDRAFLEEMIVHHEGAVEMARLVLEKSDRAELRALAGNIISAQEKEIADMKRWLGEWFR